MVFPDFEEFQQKQKIYLDAVFVTVIWGRSVCIILTGAAAPSFCLGVLGAFQEFTRQLNNVSYTFCLLKWEIAFHANKDNCMLLAVIAYRKIEWLITEVIAVGWMSLSPRYY